MRFKLLEVGFKGVYAGWLQVYVNLSAESALPWLYSGSACMVNHLLVEYWGVCGAQCALIIVLRYCACISYQEKMTLWMLANAEQFWFCLKVCSLASSEVSWQGLLLCTLLDLSYLIFKVKIKSSFLKRCQRHIPQVTRSLKFRL